MVFPFRQLRALPPWRRGRTDNEPGDAKSSALKATELQATSGSAAPITSHAPLRRPAPSAQGGDETWACLAGEPCGLARLHHAQLLAAQRARQAASPAQTSRGYSIFPMGRDATAGLADQPESTRALSRLQGEMASAEATAKQGVPRLPSFRQDAGGFVPFRDLIAGYILLVSSPAQSIRGGADNYFDHGRLPQDLPKPTDSRLNRQSLKVCGPFEVYSTNPRYAASSRYTTSSRYTSPGTDGSGGDRGDVLWEAHSCIEFSDDGERLSEEEGELSSTPSTEMFEDEEEEEDDDDDELCRGRSPTPRLRYFDDFGLPIDRPALQTSVAGTRWSRTIQATYKMASWADIHHQPRPCTPTPTDDDDDYEEEEEEEEEDLESPTYEAPRMAVGLRTVRAEIVTVPAAASPPRLRRSTRRVSPQQSADAKHHYSSPEGEERMRRIRQYLSLLDRPTAASLVLQLLKMHRSVRNEAARKNPALETWAAEIDWAGVDDDVAAEAERARLPAPEAAWNLLMVRTFLEAEDMPIFTWDADDDDASGHPTVGGGGRAEDTPDEPEVQSEGPACRSGALPRTLLWRRPGSSPLVGVEMGEDIVEE